MTSEVENILKGQVVVKTNDLKQIAVSSTNLTPDERGVAPLENQNAFVLPQVAESPVVAQEPVIQEAPVLNDNMINQSVPVDGMDLGVVTAPTDIISPVNTPAAEVPGIVSEASVLDTPTLENPVSPIEQNEIIDNIDYQKPIDNGVLTAPPVDVVSTTGLDQMNISEFVDKSIKGLDDVITEKPTEELPIQKMEMPIINEEVTAQEPVSQDNRLFENNQNEVVSEPNLTVGDTPFTIPTNDSVVLDNPIDNQELSTSEITTPDVELNNVTEDTISKVDDGLSVNPFIASVESPVENNQSVFENQMNMPEGLEISSEENVLPQMNDPIKSDNQVTDTVIKDNNATSAMELVNQQPVVLKEDVNIKNDNEKINEVINKLNEVINVLKEMNLSPEQKSAVGLNLDNEPPVNVNTFNESEMNLGTPSLETPSDVLPEIPSIDEEPIHGGKLM